MSATEQSVSIGRTLILAGQHETIRKYPEEDLFLGTIGLVNCVAVIIADKEGMVSLTHVDSNTDLSFINDELELMGKEFKIYLIKNTRMTGDLDVYIQGYLYAKGLSAEIQSSSEGTVLFNHRKYTPQIFKMTDFFEIVQTKPVSSHNILAKLGYSIQFYSGDALKFQLRTYSRQLNQALSETALQKPLLVYSKHSWKDAEVKLNADSQKKIAIYAAIKKLKFSNPDSAKTFEYVYPRYLNLLKSVEKPLVMMPSIR